MNSITRLILIGALALLSVGAVVSAQAVEAKRFTVPFTFRAGNNLLPPGTYRFTPMRSGAQMYTLSEDNSTTMVLVTGAGGQSIAPGTLDGDKVVFERVENNQYVMTQVWDSANGAAVQIAGTYPLTRAAKERERDRPDVRTIVKLNRIK